MTTLSMTTFAQFVMGRIIGTLQKNTEFDEDFQVSNVYKDDGEFVLKARKGGTKYQISVREITDD